MTASFIPESGAKFGPFEEERLFRIENSEIHRQAGSGIKSVEFVYITKKNNALFVEAKSSCPNPAARGESEDKRKKYEEYYADIVDKFADSINMFAAAVLGRFGEESIGGKLNRCTYDKMGIKFVLIITGAEEEWLLGPKAELESRLLRYRKIWKADVIVLNQRMAMDFGLIKKEQE